MRHIDQFYDAVRYGLFDVFGKNRDEFVIKAINGALKNHQFAAEIIEVWIEKFPDDYYPTDYWCEKWILLKRIAVGKRKNEPLIHILDCCISLIGEKCNRNIFSNTPYEENLTRWV